MKLIKRTWLPLAVLALGSAAHQAQAQDQQARLSEALASSERSAEDKARDQNDHPAEVVEFLGVEDGMTALDVISGGGYWTQILSAAVGPSGMVYKHSPEFMVQRGGDQFLERDRALAERLGNVEPLHGDIGDSVSGEVDVAITSNNFHDQYNRGGLEAGTVFLEDIYTALKPGGVLGLIDHEGIAGEDNAELHRIDPESVKNSLEAAGFVVEEESDLLANPDDPKTVGVRDESVSGRTQKLLILARKPM